MFRHTLGDCFIVDDVVKYGGWNDCSCTAVRELLSTGMKTIAVEERSGRTGTTVRRCFRIRCDLLQQVSRNDVARRMHGADDDMKTDDDGRCLTMDDTGWLKVKSRGVRDR